MALKLGRFLGNGTELWLAPQMSGSSKNSADRAVGTLSGNAVARRAKVARIVFSPLEAVPGEQESELLPARLRQRA